MTGSAEGVEFDFEHLRFGLSLLLSYKDFVILVLITALSGPVATERNTALCV
jgi:hypothetical protein